MVRFVNTTIYWVNACSINKPKELVRSLDVLDNFIDCHYRLSIKYALAPNLDGHTGVSLNLLGDVGFFVAIRR